jgi:hypothetical protein
MQIATANDFQLIADGIGAKLYCPENKQVVETAINMLIDDSRLVCKEPFAITPTIEKRTVIIGIPEQNGTIRDLLDAGKIKYSDITGKQEAFKIVPAEIQGMSCLFVIGSDPRGTAYGVLELSRCIGVSPWVWWADVTPEKNDHVRYVADHKIHTPTVRYRGIFLNDEDWGLLPWSDRTFDPGHPVVGKTKGAIGPKTYAKIFELLLRLRANAIWPAMHECTVPFYLVEGNKEIADKYGIVVGTSHCEPLMRCTPTEWDLVGSGDYNYLTNKDAILSYWAERLQELKDSENIFTIGMRGKHDGMMQGVKAEDIETHKFYLSQIIQDQQDLIRKYTNPDPSEVPQTFIPYKEVLDVYNAGLKVPDYVTLMWCDDNYGYIRHFPTMEERSRKGGNGIYYHVSYWGRPHDYLWLATNHPAQLYTQMKLAWDKGAQDIWILNVGDIKPAEYLTELFMDMAWDIHTIENNAGGLDKHLSDWLGREFGSDKAGELLDIQNEYYRLAWIRKPEYMGNTRTEERDPAYKVVTDLPWSKEDIYKRLEDYQKIEDEVIRLSPTISPERRDAWFQLIEYPVRGASEMNKKHLYGQLARHNIEDWTLSDQAYNEIALLTEKYNSLQNGKWRYMMDFRPRLLPVFDSIPHIPATAPLVVKDVPLYLFNGTDYIRFDGNEPLSHGLGYQRKAITMPVNTTVEYQFETSGTDSIWIEVALVPNHPVNGTDLHYGIMLNDEPVRLVDFHTEGRSEEWKQNTLCNQAIRITGHKPAKQGQQILKIKAPDEGVIIDQIKIRNNYKKL